MQTSRALASPVSRKAAIARPFQHAAGAVRMAVARRCTPSRQLSPAVMASYQPGAPPPAPGPYQPPTGTPVNGAPSPEQPLGLKPAPPPTIFTNIEALVQQTFNSQQPGQRGDWREVEGSWVLYPPSGRTPEAVVHLLGGAFVGAAPQICYRLFLEALSNRNILVVATPYSTSFDHLRIADEAQFKFDRTLRVLGSDVARLPIFGVGHSLGGLVHLLISARYAVQRGGNVLLSYNNRPATDTIPFLSPFIAPSARLLGPVLAQLSSSPVRSTMESVLETLRGVSPSIVRQVVPLVEQLAPIYLDVAQGRQEYSPSPEETRGLIKTYYAVPRNLLLRFRDDTIDETNNLVQLLQNSPAVAEVLDLSVRTLPGDHLRPLHQALVDLPPDVARVANNAVATGGSFIGRLAEMANQAGVQQASAPLEELSKAVVNGASVFGGQVGGPVTDGMQGLADEVAAWMGVGTVVVSGTRALPAANMTARPPTAGAVAY